MTRLCESSLIFLAMALLAAAPIAAEAPFLPPGSPGIDGRTIQPYRAITDWGSATVLLSELEGRKMINVIQQIEGSQVLVDHIVMDRQSLALVFRFSPYFAVGQDYLVATLRGAELSGTLNPLAGGEALPIDVELGTPVFEESVLGLVLAALPLKEGFEAELPRLGISGSTKEFLGSRLVARVVGRERIKGGDKKHYECWVVEAQWQGVDYQEKLWVSDRPPYLIRKKATFPNGNTRTSGFRSVEILK